MLLLSSQRSVERTLTRSLVNGKPRLMTSQLRLKLAKRSVATTTANCTGSRLPMMKLLSNLMLSRGRTRILLMKSRISLINWEMVDAPSMNWTNNAAVWKLRRRSSNLLLRRPKLLLNKRRIRFSGLNLNLVKLDKRLIAASKRRRRSLIILGRTMRVQWSLWLLLLRVSNVPRVRPFASRKNLNLTSMSLKLPLIMPTRPMLRDKKPSRGIKDNLGRPLLAMKNKLVVAKKSWKLLVLLNARPELSAEKLRSLGLFLTLLIAASVDWMLNCLMLALLSTRCKSSILRPCMISVVLNP